MRSPSNSMLRARRRCDPSARAIGWRAVPFRLTKPLCRARRVRSTAPSSRVLLAEDNDLNAEIACELLAEAGLVVERAGDGAEACVMFEASKIGYFDAVLMDVQMPNMNGYEATRCIRELDREDADAVPIIAMSANAFAEDVSASLASGMNAHLSKPIDMRRVLATLIKYVRKRYEG